MAIANETVTTRSYGQILKSTALIGGSSAINIVLGILKTKVLAVLLGPAGMGLMSMYSSIMSTASSVTGVGLASSGVRQIAEAEAGNDATAIASTRAALRWATMLLAWGGAIALYLLRIPISKWIFGNSKYTGAFIWLSLGVASTTINGSQTALINGLRRIGDLARIQVLGAVVGLVVSVIIVWFWRERGIEIFVAAAALTSYLLSAYYAKKIPVIKVKLDLAIIYKELKKLFSLGLVFMLTGLMSTVVPLLTRTMVMRELGLKANGIYQAAYAIAGLYIDFILTAMGKDYYPRLTGVAHDTKAINRMVNEQTEIVLLLAAPFMILL
ncbi:MAG: oligosaccharide flippase family protein, partial [Chloroflexi bacterium]|nr:oligosaccharide flippase family protein [Chloroflexota bacterium]